MFVLPKDITRKVILGKLDYDKLPYDEENEVLKGFFLEDQARVNLELEEKGHKAVCTALDELCRKESCRLYSTMGGRIHDGWSCKEYKADFPEADFDSRHHVTEIGNDDVSWALTKKNVIELKKQGAMYICCECHYAYEKKPRKERDDYPHEDAFIEICSCGSDLFFPINDFIKKDLGILCYFEHRRWKKH